MRRSNVINIRKSFVIYFLNFCGISRSAKHPNHRSIVKLTSVEI